MASFGLHYPQFEVHLRRTASGLRLLGRADLPTGTIISYSVQPPFLLGLLFGSQAGQTTVADNAFEVHLRRPLWAWKRMEVVIGLRADRQQPPGTRRLLGDRGERLAADRVGRDHTEFLGHEIIEVENG